jgi:hypothetical protein
VAPQVSELEMLKNRATVMGIRFSNNIGVEKLRAKVQAKIDSEVDNTDENGEEIKAGVSAFVPPNPPVVDVPVTVQAPQGEAAPAPERQMTLREKMYAEQMKLIRVRIVNLNPAKKDLPGEIVVVANELLGAVKRFVPFGEKTDNGWHIEQWLYDNLRERMFTQIKVRKVNGREVVETNDVREFAFEVLEPLTAEELARLAAAQAAAAGQ